jgi:hypothetical protein
VGEQPPLRSIRSSLVSTQMKCKLWNESHRAGWEWTKNERKAEDASEMCECDRPRRRGRMSMGGRGENSASGPGPRSLAWTLVANRHVPRRPATVLFLDSR